MWVFTPIGFFSVVQKTRGTEGLCVRARVAEDLDTLREVYLPELTPTTTSLHTDYAYRGLCTHEEWATALAAMARDITYSNFKSEVEKVQGKERHDVYSRVWGVMLSLQQRFRPEPDYGGDLHSYMSDLHPHMNRPWPLLEDDEPDDLDAIDLEITLRSLGVDEEVIMAGAGMHHSDRRDYLLEMLEEERRKTRPATRRRRKKGKAKK